MFILLVSFKAHPQQSLGRERVALVKAATIRIEFANTGMGTGFFINDSGLLATAWHVVASARLGNENKFAPIQVRTSTGEVLEAKVVNQHYTSDNFSSALNYDFCLLQATLKPKVKTAFLKLGNFDNIVEGDAIYTCGYPSLLNEQIITIGYIASKFSRAGTLVDTKNGTQRPANINTAWLNVTINKGNSGGPLIIIGKTVREDRVIGVVNAIYNPYAGILKPLIDTYNNALSDSIAVRNLKSHNMLENIQVYNTIFSVIRELSFDIGQCISINHLIEFYEKQRLNR